MGRRKGLKEPSGILIVDKPAGMTSHDVVGAVRSVGRLAKVGHTGTLDPFATGVLPLCINRATRLAGFLTDGAKRYDGVCTLGVTTTTQDPTGDIVEKRPVPDSLTLEAVVEASEAFMGKIQQQAPMYSAVKINGQRLYKLARKGIEVERPPRNVEVYDFNIDALDDEDIPFSIHVSKGTYIRSIAEDLGAALGCGGHLSVLRRTGAGPFDIKQALPLEEILDIIRKGELERILLPMEEALPQLPQVYLTALGAQRIRNGNFLRAQDVQGALPTLEGDEKVLIMGEQGLFALGEKADSPKGALFRPRLVLAPPPISPVSPTHGD